MEDMHTSYETFNDSQYHLVFDQINKWCEEQKARRKGEKVISISHDITPDKNADKFYGSCIVCFEPNKN